MPVATVLATPERAAGLVGSSRHLKDESIRAFLDNCGVIEVTASGPFCSSGSGTAATVNDYLDHVEHMLGIAGPDHRGGGTENAKVLPLPAPCEAQYGHRLDRRAKPRTKRPIWSDSSGRSGSATGPGGWPSANITTA